MTTNASPSADTLAAINGVLQMSVVLPQTFTPAFTTAAFALSVDKQLLDGNLAWVVFFAISAFTSSVMATGANVNKPLPLHILASAGAIHALTLREPEHDWREEAARARKQNTISRSSTLVAPPSPMSPVSSEASDETMPARSNSEDRS